MGPPHGIPPKVQPYVCWDGLAASIEESWKSKPPDALADDSDSAGIESDSEADSETSSGSGSGGSPAGSDKSEDASDSAASDGSSSTTEEQDQPPPPDAPDAPAPGPPKTFLSTEDIRALLEHLLAGKRRRSGVACLASLARNGIAMSHPKKHAGHFIRVADLKTVCDALGEDLD